MKGLLTLIWFRERMNLDEKKIKTLFVLTSKWNLAFLLIIDIGDKSQ